jgi:hypothetical protein
MCQAYEGERASIVAGEEWSARSGYAAHRDGKPLTDNPHYSGYDQRAWDHGWKCREEGIVPWSIEKRFRNLREQETGKPSYEHPTIEEADQLV